MSSVSASLRSRIRNTQRTRAGVPTVPGGLPLIGHALKFGADPDAFVTRCRQEYGDVFSVGMPGGPRTFLCDPFDAPRVFAEKRLGFHEVAAAIGSRVFGYDAERAGRHDTETIATMLSRDMRGDELQAMSERMQVLFVRRLFADLPGTPVEVPLMDLLTRHFFAAGLDAFFGEGMYTPELYAHYELVDRYFALVTGGVPAHAIPGYRGAATALAKRALLEFPNRAKALPHRQAEYARLDIAPEEGARYDASIIWASQANTVAAAFWTVRFILGCKEARRAIIEEVRSIAPSGVRAADMQPLSKDELRKMVLLDSATSEAMRLTAGPMITRRAQEAFDFELDSGRSLPMDEGQELFIYPRIHQIDREIFEDPHTFDYHRFVGPTGRAAKFFRGGRRVTMPTLPFGGGVSMCPGRHFAKNEIKILVATLLLWCESELTSPALPELDFSRIGLGILPPKQDVRVRMALRGS